MSKNYRGCPFDEAGTMGFDHIKEAYIDLLASGMLWEFFPEFTGTWEDDKSKYTSFYNARERRNNNFGESPLSKYKK